MMHQLQFAGGADFKVTGVITHKDTGALLTGLAHDTAGLILSARPDNAASPTLFTQAAGNIETITTLGTYAAPSASKCRFKEVDATNDPGKYEFQFANALLATSGAKRIDITATGANALMKGWVQLPAFDPYTAPATTAALAAAVAAQADFQALFAAVASLPTDADIATAVQAVIEGSALTEAYAANGAQGSLSQLVYAIHQMLTMFTISGTSLAVKKLDGSTNAFVVTLNNASTPTGATRS